MTQEAKYYYESHITIDPVFDERRNEASALANAWNFRLAKLYMDKGVPNQKDTFMTGHGKRYEDIKIRTERVVGALLLSGFTVRRYKIEDTLLDSHIDDELGLLE